MGEQTLSDAELFIMQQFWKLGAMKTDQLAPLVAEKEWKPTTLLTFLSRLVAKGMLETQKSGKSNLYIPVVEKHTYQLQESESLLNQLYDGSAQNFLAAMVNGQKMTAQEVQELKDWLDAQQGDE